MDLFFIARFLWVGTSISQGRIPIYSDFVAFSQYHHLWFGTLLFSLSLWLTLSIAVSAFLFLYGCRYARLWAYAQEPLRLLVVVPSVSLVPWLLPHLGAPSVALNITLLLGSEALKILSLYWAGRPERQRIAFT
jgi:hypothetical protein